MAIKYYDNKPIRALGCSYNMIVGERSNGKTYSSLYTGLEKYFENGGEIAYVRRYVDDLRGKRGASIFSPLVYNGVITKLSKGKWDDVYYYSNRWYFSRHRDDGTVIKDDKPFAYGFALNAMEHDKSTSYPGVRTIIFDEFLTRGIGLGPDEFILWMNVLSTIIRDPSRTDIEIFMLANTVNWDSVYFKEYGIENVRDMKQGTIRKFTYGDTGNCTLAFEYCENARDKKSREEEDRYFAFNNPRLKMITEGAWEMDIYPHIPIKYKPENVIFNYFINYNDEILQADIVQGGYTVESQDGDNNEVIDDNVYFTYIHRKSTPIKDEDYDLIFSNIYSAKPNQRLNMFKPSDRIGRNIIQFFRDNKVFYQDNVVGEIVNNYKEWCMSV